VHGGEAADRQSLSLAALDTSTWVFVGLADEVKCGGPQSRISTGLALEGSKPGENVYELVVSSDLLSSVLYAAAV